jgi:hypothetical protein
MWLARDLSAQELIKMKTHHIVLYTSFLPLLLAAGIVVMCEQHKQPQSKPETAVSKAVSMKASSVADLQTTVEAAKAQLEVYNQMEREARDLQGEAFANARKQYIVQAMNALQILVQGGIPMPEDMPPKPAVNMYDIAGTPETVAAYEAIHDQEMVASQAWFTLFDAAIVRGMIQRSISDQYFLPPYRIDELSELATNVIKDPATVTAITDKVAAYVVEHPQTVASSTTSIP